MLQAVIIPVLIAYEHVFLLYVLSVVHIWHVLFETVWFTYSHVTD